MPKSSSPSKRQVLEISMHWQALFIGVTVLGWLFGTASMVLLFATHGYVSTGTWAYQISWDLLPVVFFGVALGLLDRYVSFVKRVFMACLAATIGLTTFNTAFILQRTVPHQYGMPQMMGDSSWWTAFGYDWMLMVTGIVVYAVALFVATRKLGR